jgi:hypothetical protein
MPGGRGNINGKDGKPFVKGDPRINRKGQPKKIPSLDAVLQDVLGDNNEMKAVIKKVINEAKKGNIRASELLLNRVYGNVKQTIDIDGKISINPKQWI